MQLLRLEPCSWRDPNQSFQPSGSQSGWLCHAISHAWTWLVVPTGREEDLVASSGCRPGVCSTPVVPRTVLLSREETEPKCR